MRHQEKNILNFFSRYSWLSFTALQVWREMGARYSLPVTIQSVNNLGEQGLIEPAGSNGGDFISKRWQYVKQTR